MWNTKKPEQLTLAFYLKLTAWMLAFWSSVVAANTTSATSADTAETPASLGSMDEQYAWVATATRYPESPFTLNIVPVVTKRKFTKPLTPHG